MPIDFGSLKFATLEPPKLGGAERISVGVTAKGNIRVTMNSAARRRLGDGARAVSVKAATNGRDYLLLTPAADGWPLRPFGMKTADGERGASVSITVHPFTIGVVHNAIAAAATWRDGALLIEMPDWPQMRVDCGVDDGDDE